MKGKSVKIISVIAALCMLIAAVGIPTVLAAERDKTVVVYVNGMGVFPLIENEGTADERTVFPPSDEEIKQLANEVLPAVMRYFTHFNVDKLSDEVLPAVYRLFEPLACNPDGTSRFNISTRRTPGNVGLYPDIIDEGSTKSDTAVIRSAAEKFGAENVYVFSYDWRLDQLDHAKELNEYIERAKSETGAQKVVLVGGSMGGSVVASYLAAYGSDNIRHMVMLSSAFLGVSLVGELFTGNIAFNATALVRDITQLDMDGSLSKFLNIVLPALDKAGVLDAALSLADKYLETQKGRLYEEVFRGTFVTLPAFWNLVPLSYYEDAKAYLLDEERDAQLIARSDAYHYGVQANWPKMLKEAQDNGMLFSVVSHYNMQAIAASPAYRNHTDNLIDTMYTGGYATCAPIDEVLPEDYKAENPVCTDKNHQHISADGMIDASTCLAPDSTWFIKNVDHMGYKYGTDVMGLLMWIMAADEQPTVYSEEKYPQFINSSLSGEINPVKADDSTEQPTEAPSTTDPEPSTDGTEPTVTTKHDTDSESTTAAVVKGDDIPDTGVNSIAVAAAVMTLSMGAIAVAALRLKKKEEQ